MSISKDDISLYDRQIRLWGVDGQARLHSARVLIVSVDGVAVEVLKNLVLAGVGAVTLLDAAAVTDEDLGANFFVRADDIGMNRARATARRAAALNPRVELAADDAELAQVPDHLFTQFDVVVAARLSIVEMERINRVTHNAGRAFYAAGTMGWAGYAFVDLVQHAYTVERPIANGRRHSAKGPEGANREIVDVNVRPDGQSEVLKIDENFGNLQEVLARATKLPFAEKLKPRARGRVSPFLPAVLAAWDSPALSSAEVAAKAKALGLPPTVAGGDFAEEFIATMNKELSPIASVVGGFVAQDAINYLTQKQHPIQNLLIYDGKTGDAPVYLL